MDRDTASRLIEDNLHTIFAWSLSRLYDKTEAEDLAQDIICALLKSVSRIENDKAFYGYMWRVAENIFRSKIRRKRPVMESYDGYQGVYFTTPEDSLIESEQLQLLRRELSLLSKQYRESTVKYYIYGKSCSEISAELNISEEMVKYYLFKTRKILKEGIGMAREFGEKSYNPSVFRVDFWGSGNNSEYLEIFSRKLPGNIVLSAYDKPVSVTELSVELGVAAPYLEDELAILERHELIKKTGGKYQTNIIIFTDAFEKSALKKFVPVYEKAAIEFNRQLEETLSKLKNLAFLGSDYDAMRLKWTFANMAVCHALMRSDRILKDKFGDFPLLSNGSYGFVYGYDNDYENGLFKGIYMYNGNVENNAWVSVVNYCIIKRCQELSFRNEKSFSAMTDAVLGKEADENNEEIVRMIDEGVISSDSGRLFANFPVFTEKVFEEVQEILAPVSEIALSCMTEICKIAEETLRDYVPKQLKDKCGYLTAIYHQIKAMGLIIEEMVKREQLIVPDEKVNLCVFGVDARKDV